MNRYLFPLTFAFNAFSLSLLVVVAGLSGHSAMAADLSLAQAAMLAVFFSLSANARNLILKSAGGGIEKSIVQLRLLSAPVLSILALLISIYLSKVDPVLSLAIVIRQLSEWFSELQLSRDERAANYPTAKKFLAAFTVPLLGAALALLFAPPLFIPVLYVWAALPLLLCAGGIARSAADLSRISIEWKKILPNYGSTLIIGMVVFFFRLLIAGFAGKEIAGQLFTAFALGSIVGSLYERTIGPSFEISAGLTATRDLVRKIAWALPAAGAGIIVLLFLAGESSAYFSGHVYLAAATGFSLVGGFVMLGAQEIKISLLHSRTRDDVFMADLLSNFAILLSVPVLFLLFGETSFVMLFMSNAVVVYLSYWLISGDPLTSYASTREKIVHAAVAFAVVVPLFFQFGHGIYSGRQEIYDWAGRLSMLPLPLSAFLCFPLILIMHSFRGVKSLSVFTFFVFAVMMCGSVISTAGDPALIKEKVLLSLQYLVPFFGLALAEHAGTSVLFTRRMARVFLYVLMPVVVLQIGAAFYSGEFHLTPYLYFFSIYNNSQYAGVVLVSAFLLALFTLWGEKREEGKLLFMCPLMSAYTALSWSIFSLALLLSGLILFWASFGSRKRVGPVVFSCILLAGLAAAGLAHYKAAVPVMDPEKYFTAFSDVQGQEPRARFTGLLGGSVAERLNIWKFYLGGVLNSDAKTVLLGHSAAPHRSIYPSAHNYYLDILYNFGLATLLPIFLLILSTLRLSWLKRKEILLHPYLMGLGFVVFFLIFIENFFKVGLRQPYSGVYSFFLWGLFIASLRTAVPAGSKDAQGRA